MKMASKWGLLGLAMLLAATPVMAQDAASPSVLKVIPGDAWGFVAVRSLEDLNTEFLGLAKRLNLPMFGPGGIIESPLLALKAQLGLNAGFDDKGSLAVAILAGESFDDIDQRLVVFVPSSDIKALTDPLGAESAGDGLLKANLMDQEVFVGRKAGFAVISPHKGAVEKAIGAKGAIADKMTADEIKDFTRNDLYLWVNLEAVVEVAKPMIDGFLSMIETMQAGSQPAIMQAWSGMGFDQIKQMVTESRAVSMGIDFSDGGVGLDLVFAAKPGSDLAKMVTAVKGTEKSLLVGLPDEDFVIAFAARSSPAAAEIGATQLGEMLDAVIADEQAQEHVDKDKFSTFKDKLLAAYELGISGFSGSLTVLPEGPQGLIAGTVVLECRDAAKAKSLIGDIVAAAKAMVKGEEIREALKVVQHKAKAETIAGTSVDHVSIDLSGLPEVDAEDVSVIKKILGEDGLLFRVAAASPKHLAITLGGGKSRAEKIIALCKKGGAPLGDRPGIKLVNKTLPKRRQGEVYIAVDQILTLVKSIAKAVGEEADLPFNLRKIDAPVAVVSSSGANFGRVDIFLPTQLIQQLGQAAMTAMMMGG